jgi:hypothetical protein
VLDRTIESARTAGEYGMVMPRRRIRFVSALCVFAAIPSLDARAGCAELETVVEGSMLPDLTGATLDCDGNGVDDQIEYDSGRERDSDDDGLLDKCELVPGDVDLDRDVDEADGLLLSRAVGSVEGIDPSFSHGADLNQDHEVDSEDVALWSRHFYEAGGGRFECSDGYDNDGDGTTDFPADRGCRDAVGRSERADPVESPRAAAPAPPVPPERECPSQTKEWSIAELMEVALATVPDSSGYTVEALAVEQQRCKLFVTVHRKPKDARSRFTVVVSATDGSVLGPGPEPGSGRADR